MKQWLIFIGVAILIALNLLTLAIAIHDPSGRSYPYAYQPVDYKKIASMVNSELSTVPRIKGDPGPPGAPGLPGTNGSNGRNGESGKDGDRGPTGPRGPQGTQGTQGPAGKSVEIRYNPDRDDIEWRYNGDLSWQILVQTCEINHKCP